MYGRERIVREKEIERDRSSGNDSVVVVQQACRGDKINEGGSAMIRCLWW